MFQHLGQHFLINAAAIRRIISALELKKGETIIEIGPGKGALTLPLAEECEKKGCKIIAIEKDEKIAGNLNNELGIKSGGVFKLEVGDALSALPSIIHNSLFLIQNYKIVGNIPYYITGKLLRVLSELKFKPELTILMLQKEVAERIVAAPPEMNLLAAAVQFWTKPKILFSLKPSDFDPPPEVESAVIKLVSRIKYQESRTTEGNYYRLIKIIFKQPRKTILNNLRDGLNLPAAEVQNILGSLKLDPQSRPQNLSVQNIITLSEELFQRLATSD